MVIETTAIPMPLCENRDVQAGLRIAKKMQEEQHGNVPKIVTTFMGLTKRTRVLSSDQNLDLMQPLDQ